MKYITNATAIIFFLESGQNVRIEKTDKNYAKVLKIFDLPAEDQEDALLKTLNPEGIEKIAIVGNEGFEVDGDTVRYQGEELPEALVTKILSIIRDGLPLEHWQKFWERLQLNPSSSSVKELVDFLSYKELPITEDGYIIAYRGVGLDYFSIHGNKKTKVLQGRVDGQGRIWNGVGETIEVLRRDVDDNRDYQWPLCVLLGIYEFA
jgi:hypothetical protein